MSSNDEEHEEDENVSVDSGEESAYTEDQSSPPTTHNKDNGDDEASNDSSSDDDYDSDEVVDEAELSDDSAASSEYDDDDEEEYGAEERRGYGGARRGRGRPRASYTTSYRANSSLHHHHHQPAATQSVVVSNEPVFLYPGPKLPYYIEKTIPILAKCMRAAAAQQQAHLQAQQQQAQAQRQEHQIHQEQIQSAIFEPKTEGEKPTINDAPTASANVVLGSPMFVPKKTANELTAASLPEAEQQPSAGVTSAKQQVAMEAGKMLVTSLAVTGDETNPAPTTTTVQNEQEHPVEHQAQLDATDAQHPTSAITSASNVDGTSNLRQQMADQLKATFSLILSDPVYKAALSSFMRNEWRVLPPAPHPHQPSINNALYHQGIGKIPLAPLKKTSGTTSRGRSLVLRSNRSLYDNIGEESGEETGRSASRRPQRAATAKRISYREDENNFEDENLEEDPQKKKLVKKTFSSSSKPPSRTSPRTRNDRRHRDQEFDEEDGNDDNNSSHDEEESENSGSGPVIDKILSRRTSPSKSSGPEYLVKWRGSSYLHVEWLSKEELLETVSGARVRLARFDRKPLSEHHYSAREPFNPLFKQPERILHGWQHPITEDGENDNGASQSSKSLTWSYLVKWCALPVEEATWEKEETLLGIAPALIDAYHARPSMEDRMQRMKPVGYREEWADDAQLSQAVASLSFKDQSLELRPYQVEGLKWLLHCWSHSQSAIIADEMGLGKTVQSIAFLHYLHHRCGVLGPFLIVAPLSTLPHWQRECERWSDMRLLVYHGSQASRAVQAEYEFFYSPSSPGNNRNNSAHGENKSPSAPVVTQFDVLLTTYEMALAGADDHLRGIVWRVAVFDEAHRLKNRASRAAEVLGGFVTEHKVLLTGTPLQNNLEELWSLLHFLQPARFASHEHFLLSYGNLKTQADVAKLQALLRPLMLRRLKEDVEKSIPVKEETIIEVELTSIQKRYYRAILEKNFTFLMQGASSKNTPSLLNAMMELRKCCIHPYLLAGAEERILQESTQQHQGSNRGKVSIDPVEVMIQASGKLVLLDKLLAKLRPSGHKVLIFSQMTKCLDLLVDYLRSRNYPWERIDGSVKASDRQAAIDRFCAAPDPDKKEPSSDDDHHRSQASPFVFLLCTRAGGVGINLTAADTVIIFDSDWNPQNDLQAQARCHRIGQTKSVKIYRFLTRNTYEREMFDRAGLKLGLDRAVLGQKMAELLPNADDESPAIMQQHQDNKRFSGLDKHEVEMLLKKGAYGLLMEDDEAAVKFCEETIDQILEKTHHRHQARHCRWQRWRRSRNRLARFNVEEHLFQGNFCRRPGRQQQCPDVALFG